MNIRLYAIFVLPKVNLISLIIVENWIKYALQALGQLINCMYQIKPSFMLNNYLLCCVSSISLAVGNILCT